MKEEDLVLCTVDKIDGTTVFVKLDSGESGTINTSEIAPGRIRNIRDYVVPKKKIVCKVLRVLKDHIDLSLRRVTSKEKKEVMDKYKQEHTAKSALHSILKDNVKEVEEKILNDFKSLSEFFTKAKEDDKILPKYIPKEFLEKINRIVQKKQKDVEIKKKLNLKCLEKEGISQIKKVLKTKNTGTKITYISAGNFQITIKAENYKMAKENMNNLLQELEKNAKQHSCEIEIQEK
jgi:translation initiation factor 2 subunit 1